MQPPPAPARHSLGVIIFSLLILLPAALGQAAPFKPSEIELPASQAFNQWLGQNRNASAVDNQAPAMGIDLARARSAEMRSLVERDPEEFVRRTLPASDRSKLPLQMQALVEQRTKGRGSFAVSCILPKSGEQSPESPSGHQPGYTYEVRLNGVTYRAFVYGNWRNQQTVQEADIEGVALGDAIALGDAPTPTEQAAAGASVTAYSPTTTGANTLLYMITQFSDQSTDPIDEGTASSQMAVVSNFWLNASYGVVCLKGLIHSTQACDFVHVRLPSTASTYVNNFAQLLSDARSAASAQGYNYANYNLDAVITTSTGFSYAGLSYIGAQGSHWVTPYTTLRTAGHELGHNLGLYHANYWRTDSSQPFGADSNPGGYVADSSNGEWVEYGHYFSVMSAQYGGEWDDAAKPIYNPAEKVRLGWLSGAQVQYVMASGNYRLFRHDARTTTGTPRAIRIETPASDYTGYGRRYWLQYRYAPWNTAQNWFQNGIEVDVAQTSYGADGSIMLDMTPFSKDQSSPFFDVNNKPGNWWTIDNSDKLDGALIVGRTYDDGPAGIHVTPIGVGNNGTGEEYIDVVINLGTFAGDQPPVISGFNASTNQVATGQTVNFNVVASDPDGATLAYSWDFDQVQVWTASGLNSPSAAKSWSSPGQYRVVVRVSNMKGGVSTASQIITVGAPASTGEIWGRVIWGGAPVYGALVSTTSGAQAWTESDGSYVLTDLASTNTYAVSCRANNLTFTPQFTNPVSLASGRAYGVDFYANQPLAGAGGSGYIISGQVTDPVNGAAGVEVRGGGMVTTTDAAGNYQLSNLLNGAYTIAPHNPGWAFSPASRTVTLSSANSTGNNFSRVAPYSISGTFSGIPAGAQSPAPTVYLSNGRSVAATKAGTGGSRYWQYTLNNVPSGQYSISAFLYGYNMVPSGFANPLTISANASGVNFSGTSSNTIAGAVSGRITVYGVPLVGVNVSALQGGSTAGLGFSDSDGYYRIDNLPSGSYNVTAGKPGYTFSPASIGVSSVPSSGNNFAASGSISPPAISSVAANPAVVPSPTGSTTLAAVAAGSGPLTYSWDALVAPAPVTFGANDSTAAASSTVSVQAPGSYTFRVRVTDTNGFAVTGTVGVTVSAGPGAMVVSPYEIQVPGGQTVAFGVEAWDQLGNRITVSPVWSSAGGGGAIEATGLYTATTAGGPFTVIATAGGLTATGLVWVTSSSTNLPPAITTPPADLAVAAGSNVTFTVAATGTAPLTYQWKVGGSNIPGATGSSYTVMNAQSSNAGSYSVAVSNCVSSVTSATAMLLVNTAPVLAPINNQAIHAGSTLIFTNQASDIDAGQTLVFSLDPGAPPGPEVGAATGLFAWNTSLAQAGSTNLVTVRVTDNGMPSLSDAQSFVITILPPLTVQSILATNGGVTLTWGAIPGTTYIVQYKSNLSDSGWTMLTPGVVASGASASISDAAGPTQRFYRVSLPQ